MIESSVNPVCEGGGGDTYARRSGRCRWPGSTTCTRMSRSLISAISRQQLAKGAAGRRLAVDLGDEVAHAKTGGVASASLDHVGNLVVVGVDRDSKRPALAFERHRQGALLRARGAASLVVGGTPRPRLRWGAESAAGVISLSASSNFQPAC